MGRKKKKNLPEQHPTSASATERPLSSTTRSAPSPTQTPSSPLFSPIRSSATGPPVLSEVDRKTLESTTVASSSLREMQKDELVKKSEPSESETEDLNYEELLLLIDEDRPLCEKVIEEVEHMKLWYWNKDMMEASYDWCLKFEAVWQAKAEWEKKFSSVMEKKSALEECRKEYDDYIMKSVGFPTVDQHIRRTNFSETNAADGLQNLCLEQEMIDSLKKIQMRYSRLMPKLKLQLEKESSRHQQELSRVNGEKHALQESLRQQEENSRMEIAKLKEIIREKKENNSQLQDNHHSHQKEEEQRKRLLKALADEKEAIEKKLRALETHNADLYVKYQEQVGETNRLEDENLRHKDTYESALREEKEADILQHVFSDTKKVAEELGVQESARGGGAKSASFNVGAKSVITQLNAIKSAFDSRNVQLEGRKKKLKSLRVSVDEARRRNLWTPMSAALLLTATFAVYFTQGTSPHEWW